MTWDKMDILKLSILKNKKEEAYFKKYIKKIS